MYAKCGIIYKTQEYDHNCLMMHLRDNTIRFTHAIQVCTYMWCNEYL